MRHQVTSVDNYMTALRFNRLLEQHITIMILSEHTLGIYVDYSTYPTWRENKT